MYVLFYEDSVENIEKDSRKKMARRIKTSPSYGTVNSSGLFSSAIVLTLTLRSTLPKPQ